jgi:hypothetical protein
LVASSLTALSWADSGVAPASGAAARFAEKSAGIRSMIWYLPSARPFSAPFSSVTCQSKISRRSSSSARSRPACTVVPSVVVAVRSSTTSAAGMWLRRPYGSQNAYR